MITSPSNRRVADAARLKKRSFRDRAKAFLVEGEQAVGEALASQDALRVLFHTDGHDHILDRARGLGIDTVAVSDEIMAKLTSTVTPQGIVGVAGFVDGPLDGLGEGCLAVLHAIRDPGNAGTVLRSADAAGAGGVVFSTSSVDVYNPKAVRASAGSLFHVPVVRDVSTPEVVERLRSDGVTVLAAAAGAQADLYEMDLSQPVAFLFGNEAWGLPRETAALADVRVRVPIDPRAESLNLAAAATVCLFEWARQRREERRVALEAVIAAAAHDIRSPLTAMKGFAFALSRRWETMTDDQRELMFRGIAHDTDRMDAIVRLLVDASRLVSGSLDLFPERVDVGTLVRDYDESLRRDPDHPSVEWTGGEVTVLVDPDRLRSILGAFVETEVWWTNEGAVQVHGELRAGQLVLEASRARTELSDDEAEGLFQPRRPGTGSGSKIGLFVSRGIAQAQGGSADARVQDARLILRLVLPVAVPDQG